MDSLWGGFFFADASYSIDSKVAKQRHWNHQIWWHNLVTAFPQDIWPTQLPSLLSCANVAVPALATAWIVQTVMILTERCKARESAQDRAQRHETVGPGMSCTGEGSWNNQYLGDMYSESDCNADLVVDQRNDERENTISIVVFLPICSLPSFTSFKVPHEVHSM